MLDVLVAAAFGALFGFLVKRFSARLCGVSDGVRPFTWPWPELLGAGAFSISAGFLEGLSSEAGLWYLFTALLVAISITDLWAKLIPDSLSLGGGVLGILSSVLVPSPICGFLHQSEWLGRLWNVSGWPAALILSLSGAIMGFLLLEGIRRLFSSLAGLEVMGMGDSKLMFMMGAFLGPEVILISFVPASLVGVVLGLLHQRIAKTPHFPFGPSLALAGFGMAFFGDVVVSALGGMISALHSLTPSASLLLNVVLMAIAVWMILRIRKKASEYERIIDEDYHSLE